MELAKLGKKGQMSIPRTILEQAGIPTGSPVLVEATQEGTIVIRPAAVYPIEMYSDERVAEFLADDEMPPEDRERLERALRNRR